MDNLLETSNSPQLLSVQLFHLCYLLSPFQGRAAWRSDSVLFQMGNIAIPARLSPEQEGRAPAPGRQLSPAARTRQQAVTRSPSYTSVPGTRGKGSAVEEAQPPPLSKSRFPTQRSHLRFPLQLRCFRC